MVFLWMSIKWKLTGEFLLATCMPFHNWNRLFSLNLDVAYPFLQTVLAEVEWKFIIIKENSEFLWISIEWKVTTDFYGNMDVIPLLKHTVFPLFQCVKSIYAKLL